MDSWLLVCAPQELVSNLLEPVGAFAAAWLAPGSERSPSAEQLRLEDRQSSQVCCRPLGWSLIPLNWTFPPLGYLGVRHLVWRKDLCWSRLLGLPSRWSHGRISKRLATQEHQQVQQIKGSGKESDGWPRHPRAPSGLWEKAWGRIWLPGLLSDFGNKNQFLNSDEDSDKVLIYLVSLVDQSSFSG